MPASGCRRALSGRWGRTGRRTPGRTTGRRTATPPPTTAWPRSPARAAAASRRAGPSTWWAISPSGWRTGGQPRRAARAGAASAMTRCASLGRARRRTFPVRCCAAALSPSKVVLLLARSRSAPPDRRLPRSASSSAFAARASHALVGARTHRAGLRPCRRRRDHGRALSASKSAREVLRGETDRHAAFADRGGDHLRRPGANVASCKDTGATGLEQERFPAELFPRFAIVLVAGQLGTHEDEAVLVEGDLAREPPSACFGADEYHDAAGVERATLARTSILHGDSFHVALTVDLLNLVAQEHLTRCSSAMRSRRYRAIERSSPSARTTRYTCRPFSARESAACPAEFAPPTTTAASPGRSCSRAESAA